VLELSTCSGIEALGFTEQTLATCIANVFANTTTNTNENAVLPTSEIDPTSPAVSETDSRCELTTEQMPKSAAATGGGRVAAAAFAIRAESIGSDLEAEAAAANAPAKVATMPQLDLKVDVLTVDTTDDAAPPPVSKSARESSAAIFEGLKEGLNSLSARSARGGFQAPVSKSAPVSPERKPSGKMTMMERQALWMEKKKLKAEAQKKSAEEAIAKSFVGKPNIVSKKSYAAVQKKQEVLKLAAEEAKKVEEENRSKWAAVKKKVLKGKKGGGKKKEEEKKGEEKKEEAAAGAGNGLFSPMTAMARRRAKSEGVVVVKEGFEVQKSASEGDLKIEEQVEEQVVAVVAEKEGFEEGKFFTRFDENTGRAHHRVRSGADFQMSSMYRKRDKKSGMGSSVAVLVGKEEKWPNDEKAIEVIFDTDKMDEKKAWLWWQEHGSRFASPKKPEKPAEEVK